MKFKSLFFGLAIFCSSPIFSQSVEKGLKHLELEQYESSKKEFRSLIQKDPSNPEYYYYLGDVYLKTENADSAKYFFSEGIKKKEGFALNHVGLGKAIASDNAAEGKKNFDKALELSKHKDAKVMAAIAEYYINAKNKDIAYATELMEKAIKLEPKNSNNYFLMGDAYLEKNEGSKAIGYYKQGEALNKSAYAYFKMGKLYARSNRKTALEYFQKGLTIDPNYGPLHREIGEVYYKVGQYKNAIDSYKKYVELSDKSFDTDLRYASFLYFNKDYKGAIAILSELAKKDPKHLIVNRLLAYSYFETKEYAKGVEIMENFWKNSDDKKQIASDFEYYGKLLIKAGKDTSLAITNLKKAIEMDTSKGDLNGEIGRVYMDSKKYKEAAGAYRLKVARGATLSDYMNLGKAYYFDDKGLQADSAFVKYIALDTASPTGYLWRARANYRLDKDLSKGLAKPFYEKYIEMTKSNQEKYKNELLEAYKILGAYYMKRRDKTNADINWKKVKELDPTNKEVDGYIKAQY